MTPEAEGRLALARQEIAATACPWHEVPHVPEASPPFGTAGAELMLDVGQEGGFLTVEHVRKVLDGYVGVPNRAVHLSRELPMLERLVHFANSSPLTDEGGHVTYELRLGFEPVVRSFGTTPPEGMPGDAVCYQLVTATRIRMSLVREHRPA